MNRMILKSSVAHCLVVLTAFAIAGCKDKKDPEQKPTDGKAAAAKKQGSTTDKAPKHHVTKRPTKVVVPPPIAQVPPVKMSKQHRDQLSVFQNDALPAEILDGELIGLDGKAHTLRTEMGAKLTVVLFWSSDHAYATEELRYLAAKVAQEFGDQGVKIVTINQRDTQAQARQAAGDAGASALVTLLDSEKTLKQLASGSVPRTYLLDAEGRVLWLDTVFDRTTQRDLHGAIDFVLNKS
jgi:hypothetical protein